MTISSMQNRFRVALNSRNRLLLGVLSTLCFSVALLSGCMGDQKGASSSKPSESRSITMDVVAVEINGTKFWFPSTIIAKKGDTVNLRLVSKIGGQNNVHGFKIAEFGIEELVQDQVKEVKFVADKTGLFKIFCHLHPTHVGGQLLVTD